jgi:hypothetical protein
MPKHLLPRRSQMSRMTAPPYTVVEQLLLLRDMAINGLQHLGPICQPCCSSLIWKPPYFAVHIRQPWQPSTPLPSYTSSTIHPTPPWSHPYPAPRTCAARRSFQKLPGALLPAAALTWQTCTWRGGEGRWQVRWWPAEGASVVARTCEGWTAVVPTGQADALPACRTGHQTPTGSASSKL